MTITIDAANGTEFSCGDIGGANCWLDVIEHKQPIQFSTAAVYRCGRSMQARTEITDEERTLLGQIS